MSNRIDFFQTDRLDLTIPCSSISVFLEGELCPFLELVKIFREGWPDFSRAVLRYVPVPIGGQISEGLVDVETIVGTGKRMSIRQIYNRSTGSVRIETLPIFSGKVESINIQIDSGEETATIIARDLSVKLRQKIVYGRRALNIDGQNVFAEGLETVFNKDGKPNASTELIQRNGKDYTVFSGTTDKRYWSCAQAIDYLLSEYIGLGRLYVPSLDQLEALTEGQKICDLDVTGLNLLEALRECCNVAGLEFKFLPGVGESIEEAIVFYRNGIGRTIELNYQPGGKLLNISKTDICQYNSENGTWAVTNRYIGQGDFKVYEATFELVKGWDPALETSDYSKYSPSTNPDFYQVKDVYRKWVLNEAGDYSGSPFNQGNPFDFSGIFDGSSYVTRNRRFWPTLTTDKQGRSLGYFVEVSYDGVQWWQYLSAFNVLLDECGIWLSNDQLDFKTLINLVKDNIEFRITASVVSDERLNCVVADGPVNSVIPVKEHILISPRQFKYRKVTSSSIFLNGKNEYLGQADEADDTNILYEYVRKQALAGIEPGRSIKVQMPYVILDYEIGDVVVSSTESRDWLGCNSDNRSEWWLKKIGINFEKQCTDIEIVNQRSSLL